MTTAQFDFCTSPRRSMITASVVEADPGTFFLCLEDGDDAIEVSVDQVGNLMQMITSAVAGVQL